VASEWDAMRLAYYDERVIEKVAEVSGVGEASEVADVGTGTGFVAAGLATRVERVVGIDYAPAMLEVARENLRALGASNVDLVVGEASQLPLAEGAVDAAFANMVLHHSEDPDAEGDGPRRKAGRHGGHHRRGGPTSENYPSSRASKIRAGSWTSAGRRARFCEQRENSVPARRASWARRRG
jgi:SAM-dependent methyltransferase